MRYQVAVQSIQPTSSSTHYKNVIFQKLFLFGSASFGLSWLRLVQDFNIKYFSADIKRFNMSDDKAKIFDHISKSEINELKAKLTAYNGSVDFTDENGELGL